MFKKLKQLFCYHYPNWEPIELIELYYNEFDIRYASCHCICKRCGKRKIRSYMLRDEFQKWYKNNKTEVNDMEKIKELKEEAYKIATQKCGYSSEYSYCAEDRTEAMKTYALLTIAENMSKDKKEG